MLELFNKLKSLIFPSAPVLGRWQVKTCKAAFKTYTYDPGYQHFAN